MALGLSTAKKYDRLALNLFATPSRYRVISSGTYAGIETNASQENALASELLKTHEHMQCWNKEDIPLRFHYEKKPRVPRFVCLADIGWLIVSGRGLKKEDIDWLIIAKKYSRRVFWDISHVPACRSEGIYLAVVHVSRIRYASLRRNLEREENPQCDFSIALGE